MDFDPFWGMYWSVAFPFIFGALEGVSISMVFNFSFVISGVLSWIARSGQTSLLVRASEMRRRRAWRASPIEVIGPQGGDILDLILYYIYILTLSLKPICFQQFLFNSMCFQQVYLYIQCIFNNLISAFIAKFNVFSTLLFLF